MSFDIKSLYTNVPLEEVIDDITETVFSETAPTSVFRESKNITRKVFKNILKLCSEGIFVYKDNVYKQVDGVAMGSPLAPLLANWFVCKVENNIFDQDNTCKPVFYKRYVDDIFAMFNKEEEIDRFHSVLNGAHCNLSFTKEMATNILPFLDTAVSVESQHFVTEVYRKPTNTGILMNYRSNAPWQWKKALIKCLLSRAYRVSSSFTSFNSEVKHISESLMRNSYPSHRINNVIKEFFAKHNIDATNFKRSSGELMLKEKSDDQEAFFKVPFVGAPSLKLQRQIRKELEPYGLYTRATFSTTKVGTYFNLKSRCSPLFSANVVYLYTCSCDKGVSYVGETRRQLYRRIAEHSKVGTKSAIFDHLIGCDACQNDNIAESFEILQRCNASNICSVEALYITKLRPSLNIQLGPSKGAAVSLALYK